MGRKRATWSLTNLAQFKQLIPGPVHVGDLISKRSAKALVSQGFVDIDKEGHYSLNEYGEDIATILQETEGEQDT